MRQLLLTVSMALVVALALAPPVSATMLEGGTWKEDPDAGNTLSAAQVILGSGLVQIDGFLGEVASDTVDMFKIMATGAQLTAWEMIGSDPYQLFLFDSNGRGVKASVSGPGGFLLDEDFNPTDQPVLPLVASVTPGELYYLAIAVNIFRPFTVTTADKNPDGICPSDYQLRNNRCEKRFEMFALDNGDASTTPLDPLTTGMLDGWTDGVTLDPPFSIGLIGAAPAAQVPEPATLVLVGTGLIGLGLIARRRRR